MSVLLLDPGPAIVSRRSDAVIVLHLLDTSAFAGTERHVLELLKALSEQGVRPLLGCRAGSELFVRAQRAGVQVGATWSSSGLMGLAAGLCAVRKLIRRHKVDLVHAHNGRTSLIAACINQLDGVKVIATQHFIDPQFTTYRGPKRLIASWMHNWVNHRLSAVLCVSRAAQQSLLQREKISPDKVRSVPNGILPLVATSKSRIATLRTELKADRPRMLVVAVCRLEPEKGIDFLLQAFALLSPRFTEVQLVIAGEGSQREALEREAKRLSILDNVTFLGFRNDVPAILAAADIFVLPSPAEPFGLAVLEAMSLGKPVIACNAGGPAEILTNGIDGLLIVPGNAASLAEALVLLIQNPQLCEELGTRARTKYGECYTAEIMGNNTLSVYQSVIQAGSAPGSSSTV